MYLYAELTLFPSGPPKESQKWMCRKDTHVETYAEFTFHVNSDSYFLYYLKYSINIQNLMYGYEFL